jgi:hypothetical protein
MNKKYNMFDVCNIINDYIFYSIVFPIQNQLYISLNLKNGFLAVVSTKIMLIVKKNISSGRCIVSRNIKLFWTKKINSCIIILPNR